MVSAARDGFVEIWKRDGERSVRFRLERGGIDEFSHVHSSLKVSAVIPSCLSIACSVPVGSSRFRGPNRQGVCVFLANRLTRFTNSSTFITYLQYRTRVYDTLTNIMRHPIRRARAYLPEKTKTRRPESRRGRLEARSTRRATW